MHVDTDAVKGRATEEHADGSRDLKACTEDDTKEQSEHSEENTKANMELCALAAAIQLDLGIGLSTPNSVLYGRD